MQPRNALLSEQYRQQIKELPAFYQTIHQVWRTLGGGVANGDVLSLQVSSDVPLGLEQISARNVYALLRSRNYKEPHCIQKYLPIYGQLHWSQTWSQLHICDLDRKVIDLNWQIAHGVLYTGARLAHSFGMRHIESLCFCRADDETLESECLNKVIAKLKFILQLLFKRCKSPAQICAFEREWLARGSLGHLEGEELVFSF